jgi:uncharacterized protein (TIGR00369 family)
MNTNFKTVASSYTTISELMLPSNANFRGKVHGGYILSLLDQIAFTCASKFSGNYCVTASVDTVNFLRPIEVGELITMKASVNYVGTSSMIVGIRVESENIQTGFRNHCNSSYFTMVSKDEKGNNALIPGLIISNIEEVRRFCKCLKQNSSKREKILEDNDTNYGSIETLSNISKYNIIVDLK